MNSNQYDAFIKEVGKSNLLLHEPLSRHTYFRVGGPADLFYTAKTTDDLVRIVKLANKHSVPYFVLGGGSNIIVTDKGIRGLVIKNKTNSIQLKGFAGKFENGKYDVDKALVAVDSGVPANMLIRYTIDESLEGLEDFLGLPGSVGGAIYNNSHHLGKLIGDHVSEVSALTQDGELKTMTQKELKFDYDYSIFQKTRDTILSAKFLLKKGDKSELWPKAEAAVRRRSDTQPLGFPSSGCIFKNIPMAEALRLGTPNHTTSAGYLIDKSGLKGIAVGDAQVSDKHANFIVNKGSATHKDIIKLIKKVKAKVKETFGVNLQLEVFIVGEA